MAYQNVGTPRFYINAAEWLASVGIVAGLEDVFRTLPVNPSPAISGSNVSMTYGDLVALNPSNTFFAALGHTSHHIYIEGNDEPVTSKIAVNYGAAIHHGFTIVETTGSDYSITFDGGSLMGSFITGTYYEMPHSPNQSLKMSRDMDGVKRMRTAGGSELAGYRYTKPKMWGELSCWELGTSEFPQNLSRLGRRTWDLSFSSFQDSDIFPDVSSLANYEVSGWGSNQDPTENTLLNEDTFFSQVIHRTNGGQLPFIFQPDKDNFNPDQFAICKFNMNGFKFTQVANGVYDIKIKIKEVW